MVPPKRNGINSLAQYDGVRESDASGMRNVGRFASFDTKRQGNLGVPQRSVVCRA